VDADVIVLGGGAAGLAAARRLAERSLRVILLEARDRLGGRVWSQPTTRAATPAELGAEFIHGEAEQTLALLREAGTAAIDIGGVDDDDDFVSAANLFNGASSLPRDESVDEFLRRFAGDESKREAATMARAFVEGFEAADPAIASVRAIAAEWESGVDSTSARPLGGYHPVFERLREACVAAGVAIHLSMVVKCVSWRSGEVAVEAVERSGKEHTFRSKAAIATLPAGVLRHSDDDGSVRFDPELPAAKRDALRSIEMGQVVKVVLTFRTAFWERIENGRYRETGFFRSEGQPFPTYWTQLPVRTELVSAWAGGPKAAAIGELSPPQLIERALCGFGTLLEAEQLARDEFEAGYTHDWRADPFARGAYSYVAVGGGDARAVLAAPVDATLFFAGEATSTDGQGGTVNGALESGERAAAEVFGV
jgi:monoamine oxidase